MTICPCGKEVEGDYFEKEIYDVEGNAIGFICVHKEFISYGE